MRHAFATSTGCRRGNVDACIFGLYNDLQCPVDGQISALRLPDRCCTNSPIPEGGKASLVWVKTTEPWIDSRCHKSQRLQRLRYRAHPYFVPSHLSSFCALDPAEDEQAIHSSGVAKDSVTVASSSTGHYKWCWLSCIVPTFAIPIFFGNFKIFCNIPEQ